MSFSFPELFRLIYSSIAGLFTPNSETYWVFLISGVVLTAFAYRKYHMETSRFSPLAFVRFLFPLKLLKHRSVRIDYEMCLLNFFYGGLISGVVLKYFPDLGVPWKHLFSRVLGQHHLSRHYSYYLPDILFTIALFMAADLAFFLVHLAFHKIPVLWEFHKVHHSAEAINPITAYRGHPLNLLATQVATKLLIDLLRGLFGALYPGMGVSILVIKGVNCLLFSYNLIGGYLRHSSVWLHFGHGLNHIIYTPAHHQIHHSENPKHWGKNLGGVLAIWDKIAGTLYLPDKKEELSYGLADAAENNSFNRSVFALYYLPFVNIWSRHLEPWFHRIRIKTI
jgi:sterol desaturase/sphingolipid hydroxylase (fatty acid hydroxylase superfamily)